MSAIEKEPAATEPTHSRLDAAMGERRLELGIRWQEVAKRAGVTAFHLRRVRIGVVPLSPDLEAGIERALKWPRGHIARLGGSEDAPAPAVQTAHGLPIDPEVLARYDPIDRDAVIAVLRAAERNAAAKRDARHSNEGRRTRAG